MIHVSRREDKYPLDLMQATVMSGRISGLLRSDVHSRNGCYKVRTLYFDTVDDKDFFDKVTEQNLRRKIRMRIYHPTDMVAKLELKQKENVFQKKRSLIVNKIEALEIIRGNYEVLLKYKEPFAAELYAIMKTEGYRPKSIVEYDRRAFVAKENNIRLTFDSNIRGTESSYDLFSEQLLLTPLYPPDQLILEVKYDRFLLNYISEVLSAIDKRSCSTSKYCLSRNLGYPL